MKKLTFIPILVLFSFLFFSCSSKTPRYSLDYETQMILKKHAKDINKQISIKVYGNDSKSMLCRLAKTISPPDGKTYLEYLKDAIVKELMMQDLYMESSPETLTIYVKDLKFDSISGKWIIASTVTLPNGKTFNLNKSYEFGFVYIAEQACNEVSKAYFNFVQDYIKSLISNQNFIAYLTNNGKETVAK